jgi:hypothetical protein
MSTGSFPLFNTTQLNAEIATATQVNGVVGTGTVGALGTIDTDFVFTLAGNQVVVAMSSSQFAMTATGTGYYAFPAGTIPTAYLPAVNSMAPIYAISGGAYIVVPAQFNTNGSINIGNATTAWAIGQSGIATTPAATAAYTTAALVTA